MKSAPLLAGLARLQQNLRLEKSIGCQNALSDLAAAGLLALAAPQVLQLQRSFADEPAQKSAAKTTPAPARNPAPSSKPSTVLDAKREYRKQQQQQQREGTGPAQSQSPTRPQVWPQVDAPVPIPERRPNLGLRLPKLRDESSPAVAQPEVERQQRVIGTDATVHELQSPEDINLYFPMPASSLTEAFRSREDGPAAFLPPAGCSGLQGEYEHTGKEFVMLRSCMDALFQIAEHAQGQGPGDTDPSAEGKPAPEEAGADEAAGKAENVRDQAETSVAEPEASGARPQAAAFSGPADIRRPDTTGPFLQPGQIQAAADTGKLYLVGPAGSGKSVALAALAHWARTAGWLVFYVPSAKALIEGGTFHQHESGVWDNPVNARLLLTGLLHHHEDALNSMPAPGQMAATDSSTQPRQASDKAPAESEAKPSAGGEDAEGSQTSLGDIARAAMDPLKDDLPVQAVLDIVDHLLKQDRGPVLFAIDDYPALCLPATDYGISTSEVSRRQLSTSELRLTAALHMMMREAPKRGLSVCAAHGSTTISHLQPVPINGAAVLPLHRYNHAEVHSALAWYTAQGKLDDLPDDNDASWVLQMTSGNATELRKTSYQTLVDFTDLAELSSAST